MRKLFAVTAFCLALAAVSWAREFPNDWTWDDSPDLVAAHSAIEGHPMPTLDLEGWINGQVTPEMMKGKVVVIDFYATWCGPCMAAVPHNNELSAKYKDQGLVLFGVCTNEQGQDQMPQVVKEHNIQYPTARDPRLNSEKAWHVQYYPTYAVVDRKGIVRAIGLQPDHVEEVVQKLLAEK
ncbi:MAG TPA: redoxin family protein [Tepidisphaeraceae bacterium]|jgi:thiol-disulfide isomerase/thioredoxin